MKWLRRAVSRLTAQPPYPQAYPHSRGLGGVAGAGLTIVAAGALLLGCIAHASTPHLQVRVGQSVAYYDGCRFATNILEPGAADDSYLVAADCMLGETTTVQAPSWIVDAKAAYGSVWVNGEFFGECWLIRQQLLDNAGRALLIECSESGQRIYGSGFDGEAASR